MGGNKDVRFFTTGQLTGAAAVAWSDLLANVMFSLSTEPDQK